MLTFQACIPTFRNAPERPALRERLALCFKELLESTFGGHLSSTSMFGSAQRTLSRIADSLTLMNRLEAGALGYPTLAGKSSPLPVGWLLRFDRASSGIP